MRSRRPMTVAACALFVLGACGGDDPELTKPKRTTTTVEQFGNPTNRVPSGEARVTSAENAVYATRGDYEDGRHIGKIRSFENSTVGVDVVEFLTGEEAKEAYARDTGATDGPPNDYYVRNTSTTVRLLPVADDVVIRVNSTGGYPPSDPNEGRQVSAATFAGYLERGPVEALFWVTIDDSDVITIEEQYVP